MYYTWDITVFAPLMEFEYSLKNEIDSSFTYGSEKNLKTELESGIQ